MSDFLKKILPTRRKKYNFFILLIVLILFGVLVDKGYDVYEKTKLNDKLQELYPKLSQACLSSVPEAYGTIPERLRNCVHINTVGEINEEFYRDWKDKVAKEQGVLDYMEGRRTEKKPYECSTRSGLLLGLLRFNGYKARDVITAKFLPKFDDHVIVEVWDEELQDWEALGPSYNAVFRDESGNKLSVLKMVTLGVDKFQPCFQDGRCGWDLKTDEGLRMSDAKSYWGNMVVKNENDVWQVIYNPAYFDPQKPLDGQTYCQKREKFCRVAPLAVGELKL